MQQLLLDPLSLEKGNPLFILWPEDLDPLNHFRQEKARFRDFTFLVVHSLLELLSDWVAQPGVLFCLTPLLNFALDFAFSLDRDLTELAFTFVILSLCILLLLLCELDWAGMGKREFYFLPYLALALVR